MRSFESPSRRPPRSARAVDHLAERDIGAGRRIRSSSMRAFRSGMIVPMNVSRRLSEHRSALSRRPYTVRSSSGAQSSPIRLACQYRCHSIAAVRRWSSQLSSRWIPDRSQAHRVVIPICVDVSTVAWLQRSLVRPRRYEHESWSSMVVATIQAACRRRGSWAGRGNLGRADPDSLIPDDYSPGPGCGTRFHGFRREFRRSSTTNSGQSGANVVFPLPAR